MTKIIENLILPPGIFIFLIIGGIILIWKNRKTAGFIILGAAAFLLYLLSTGFISYLLLHSLEVSYDVSAPFDDEKLQEAEAIVVLGGGVNPFSPEYNGGPSLSAGMEKRIIKGFLIHQKTGLPVIVAGGNLHPDENALSEGEVGKMLLLQLGMDEKDLFVEDNSLNTAQNAANIMTFSQNVKTPLAASRRSFKTKSSVNKKIILVTSAYHMNRSLFTFERAGFSCLPAACDFKMAEKFFLTPMGFVPSASNLGNSVAALRERLGLLFYALMY